MYFACKSLNIANIVSCKFKKITPATMPNHEIPGDTVTADDATVVTLDLRQILSEYELNSFIEKANEEGRSLKEHISLIAFGRGREAAK